MLPRRFVLRSPSHRVFIAKNNNDTVIAIRSLEFEAIGPGVAADFGPNQFEERKRS